MGWPTSDGSNEQNDKTDGDMKKDEVKAPESEEDLRKKHCRFVRRQYKKQKSIQYAYDRLVKKFGDVMTLEEVTAICEAQERKSASRSLPSPPSTTSTQLTVSGEELSSVSTAETGTGDVVVSTTAKKRHRSEKSSVDCLSFKSKHCGRPPDEDKQRTIIETVKHNPTISLRTVAANLECSKSQVARVLALNGYQRNKGRIGEWQLVSEKNVDLEDNPNKEDKSSLLLPPSSPPTTATTTTTTTTTSSRNHKKDAETSKEQVPEQEDEDKIIDPVVDKIMVSGDFEERPQKKRRKH